MLKIRCQAAWSKAIRDWSQGWALASTWRRVSLARWCPTRCPCWTWQQGRLLWPRAPAEFAHTPAWAKPLLEAALDMQPGR